MTIKDVKRPNNGAVSHRWQNSLCSKNMLSKLIATLLMATMLFSMGSVMASEVEEDGIPQGYVAIATKTESLSGGITLEKTLAVEQSKSRIGFSGERSALVIHRYSQNGVEKLCINALGVFYSVPDVNTCTVDSDKSQYRIPNDGNGTSWNFYNIRESFEYDIHINDTVPRYSTYTVSYQIDHAATSYPDDGTMWVKCTSNANVTTSGNGAWRSVMAQDGAVIYDNVAYQFN